MSAADEVREALKHFKPEHSVKEGYWGTYAPGTLHPPGRRVIVFIKADDPESYRAEIEKLLQQAGLTDIHLVLYTKYPPAFPRV
jgi:hypothetical protein